jgi:uncharacterized protein (DUF2236 family)
LQLWVAACMYCGARDAITLVGGGASLEELEEVYRHCSRFATTLQVAPSQWPDSLAAFEEYWNGSLELVEMDDLTREYLRGFVRLSFLPRALNVFLGPAHEFITAGFLPDAFRTELGLAWDDRRQRRFEHFCRVSVVIHRALPRAVRELPLNLVWWDTQRRYRRGRSFV